MSNRFSWSRIIAMLAKEFIQLRRDRLTFAMMVAIPLLQLVLFGYAINTDPKHLPTAVLSADQSPFSRSFVRALENSGYFQVVEDIASEAEANRLLAIGEVQFVVSIPENFSRKLARGERPVLLVEADATDPAATSNALAALLSLNQTALQRDLEGSLGHLQNDLPPFEVRVHRRYNPEGITQYNIVPGLMGVILTMTMVMMTSIAVTREHERGTLENLLATPVKPAEVMVGKIFPYIIIGYVQVALILGAAIVLFNVPFLGSLALLSFALVLFMAAHLSVGFSFSTIAKNQMQAMQMTFFFYLPSLLLSGFMFPFRGMPSWAQWIGEVFPLTHFLRIVRGILLKGNGLGEITPNLWPIALFLTIVASLALRRYRETLD
jgi:ABC-2 type transport system permease protein